MNAIPFDYDGNLVNAAEATAVAACRREDKKSGEAYRVVWANDGGLHCWEGCRYDALSLAKDLAFNPSTKSVSLAAPNGVEIDIASARY